MLRYTFINLTLCCGAEAAVRSTGCLLVTGPVLLSVRTRLQEMSVSCPAEWQAWHPEEAGSQPAAGCTTGSHSQARPLPLSSLEAALQGTRSTERAKGNQARCELVINDVCRPCGRLYQQHLNQYLSDTVCEMKAFLWGFVPLSKPLKPASALPSCRL